MSEEIRFGPPEKPPLDGAKAVVEFAKWWETFKGSTHEPHGIAAAAFMAGYRAACMKCGGFTVGDVNATAPSETLCERCYGSGEDPDFGDGITSQYCKECGGMGLAANPPEQRSKKP